MSKIETVANASIHRDEENSSQCAFPLNESGLNAEILHLDNNWIRLIINILELLIDRTEIDESRIVLWKRFLIMIRKTLLILRK